MLIKILGLLVAFLGLLVLKYFPDISDYQKKSMLLSGILIGVIMIVLGIVMLIFGD